MNDAMTFDQGQRVANNLYRQLQEFVTLQHFLQPTFPLPLMRHWGISPDFGALLLREVMRARPHLVVELGSGISTLIVGYCLKRQGFGRLVSIEHEREYLERTRAEVRDHGLEDWVELHFAPLVDRRFGASTWRWYDVSSLRFEAPVEVLVVDGPPGVVQRDARYPALPAFAPLLAPGATLLLDDAARPDEMTIVDRWVREAPGATHEYLPLEKGASIVRLPPQ